MILYCARCCGATAPFNFNGDLAYACPQCGAVYVRREKNIYSFLVDLQGAHGAKEMLNQCSEE